MDLDKRLSEVKGIARAVALGTALLNFNAVSLIIETDEEVLRDLELPDEVLMDVLDSMDDLINEINIATDAINPVIKHIRATLNKAGVKDDTDRS